MLIIGYLVIAIVLFLLWRRKQNGKLWEKIRQFDSPPTLPFFGNSLMLKGSPTENFKILHKLFQNYPSKCYVMWFFNTPCVVTGRREDVKAISKMIYKGPLYDFFKVTVGNGLLISYGEKWKKSRLLVESVFAASELSTNLLHIFNEQSQILVDEISQTILRKECNVWPLILKSTIRIISQATMGSTKQVESNISDGYGEGSKRGETIIMKRFYSPWLYPEFMFKLYLFLTKQSQIFDNIRTPFLQAIRKRKQAAFEKNTPSKESQPTRKLILDALMDFEHFSEKDLTDEIITLMFAGSDTTATSACFTLLMLAMNQDVQEKVYEELNSVFDETHKDADVSDLSKLTFLEQCIKETMRRFSTVPLIYRHAITDLTLSDGRVIPAGANVILSIFEIHNNPEYYPNPEIWNPHNFDPDLVAKRPCHSFIPFTTGARMCVGYKFAMMSLKVLLSHILRNFRMSTNQSEVKLNFNVLVKCVNGYHIKFEPRK